MGPLVFLRLLVLDNRLLEGLKPKPMFFPLVGEEELPMLMKLLLRVLVLLMVVDSFTGELLFECMVGEASENGLSEGESSVPEVENRWEVEL